MDLLTEEEANLILHNYLGTNNVNVINFTVKSLTNTTDGFLGDYYSVKIEYENESKTATLNLFMKVADGKTEIIQKMITEAHSKEVFFYDNLMGKFKQQNIITSFAPIPYLCTIKKLALEDLNFAKFTKARNTFNFDTNHCKIALVALAKFHASSVIYENQNPSLLKQFPKELGEPFSSKNDTHMNKWLESSLKGIFSLLQILNKSDFKEKIKNVYDNYTEAEENGSTFAVIHRDLWSNNFLFKYENDQPTMCKIIDFQMICYGSVAIDVNHLILSNTRKKYRDENYDKLLVYYHNTLKQICDQHNITIQPLEEFKGVCRKLKIGCKLYDILDRATTLSAPEDNLSSEKSLQNFLLYHREKITVHSFQNDPLYKEILQEDILELCDMLL